MEGAKSIPQWLNRLRKKTKMQKNLFGKALQGLKPTSFYWLCRHD